MKTKFAAIAASLATAVVSYGAVYNVTTGTTATSNGFAPTGLVSNPSGPAVDNSSNTYVGFQSSGTVAFGYFNVTDSAITSATSLTDIVSAFVQFGASGSFNAAGPTGQRGVFARNTSATVASTGFDGKNIYVLVGNGASFATSSELAVLRTSTLFAGSQDLIPTAQTVTVTTANSTLLFGVNLSNVRTTTSDASTTPGWGTAQAVPEPSSAVLAALGALAMLRRRRA